MYTFSHLIFGFQFDLEKECPDIMKLGLLHEERVRKASARKQTAQPAYLSYGHKSLQEFGASKFVTERLETAENVKVSFDKNETNIYYSNVSKSNV